MKLIGFDIETRGTLPEYALQAYRQLTGDAHISCASISTTRATIGTHSPSLAWITQALTTLQGQYVVAWNTCFDVSWLYAAGIAPGLIEGVKWLDGMLLWMHLTREPESDTGPKRSYSLETAMKEFYPDDAGFKDFTDFQNDTPEALAQLLNRNKEDARYTRILAERFWGQLSENQRRSALIEARCIPMVALTYVRGLQIDSGALSALRAKLEDDAVSAYALLKEHYPDIDNVNLGSPKQVGALLYEYWNLHPPKMTPKGEPSTDKFALHALAETYPQARSLRDYRESQYNLAKYVTATEESVKYNGDDTTRPQAKIFGTYTGRMTYYSKQGKGKAERPTGIALHQWKRGADFRNLICPPHGYSLLELDFAGQEFGLMAVASGDERMLALRADGEDAHSFMGSQIAKVSYADLMRRVKEGDKEASQTRKLGKFANLSFQYRIGAKAATTKAKVEYGLDLSEGFVQSILNTYKQSYPRVPIYWQESIQKSKHYRYAETFAGRRINLNGDWFDKKTSWALESTAINYPIQGTGGDQKYLALAVARQVLPSMNGYFYYELHDGLFFILPNETAERDGRRLRHILSNLPYESAWGWNPGISFPVDLKIGPSWGALKEIP